MSTQRSMFFPVPPGSDDPAVLDPEGDVEVWAAARAWSIFLPCIEPEVSSTKWMTFAMPFCSFQSRFGASIIMK